MKQAVILAAGAGLRLRSVSYGKPKCLLSIGGQPLIEHQVRILQQFGIKQICVIIGHEANYVRAAVSPACGCITNVRYAETNSLYSLWLARQWVSGPFILLNGDVLAHPEIYRRLLTCHDSALAYDSCSGQEAEHMKVSLEGTAVRALGKDLPAAKTHGENVGILKFNAEAAAALFTEADALIAHGRETTWAPAAVDRLARKTTIRGIDVADLPWTEIDFPDDLAHAQRDIWPVISEARGPAGKPGLVKSCQLCESSERPASGRHSGGCGSGEQCVYGKSLL
jgi:L-glutamine-phosphate cytidylyltransferase